MTRKSSSHKTYLAPGEVARILMVSPATVRHWASKGDLNSVTTPGGHRRFMRHEIVRFARVNGLTMQLPDDDKLRILIVDDDVQLAAYLSRLLKSKNANVATMVAHDGYAAGRLVQVFHPHIILLDLMMPGLNGFDVCKQIKSDVASKAIRVIAMTGFYDNENVARALRAGAECCIEKPIDQEKLLTLLGIDDSFEVLAVSGIETTHYSD